MHIRLMTSPHTNIYAPRRNVQFHTASFLLYDTAKYYLRETDIYSISINVGFFCRIVTYAALVLLHPLLQIYKIKRQELGVLSNAITIT